MKVKYVFCAISLTVIISCTSATQLMQGTVGKDISQVMIEYGPPAAQFDLPDGRRAYQWLVQDSYTSGTGYTNNWTGMTTVNTATSTASCHYTLYTRQSSQGRWTVIDYEPPKTGCEYVIQ